MGEQVHEVESSAESDVRPSYHTITLEMVESVSFEGPICNAEIADCADYRDLFTKAADVAASEGDTNRQIVYGALGAICGFHFRPQDVNDPYGPMVQMGDSRSAIPADFRENADVIAFLAEIATDAPLKARLSDVAWMLNRRRSDLGRAAIGGYRQTIQDVRDGVRKFRFEESNSPLSAQSRNILKRALSLSSMKTVGRGSAEEIAIKQLAKDLLDNAFAGTSVRNFTRMAKISSEYDVVPPIEVARSAEEWLQANKIEDDHSRLDLLRVSSAAYHEAGAMKDHFRCRLEAVETQVRMAQLAEGNSAMLAAGLLADAITGLHGIPNVREKRRELRHRLIDVQTNIGEEMGTFTQKMDLSEIIAEREAIFEDLCLRDMLFLFADMESSPSPAVLREKAMETISESPLQAIFSSSFHDKDGKVSFRSSGLNLNSSPDDGALRPTIAQAETIRRKIFASGDIHTARRIINERFLLDDDTFIGVLKYSGCVPSDLLRTFSRGFRRFFQGDAVSGLYILTPLLEASIRHVLKTHGHDVSTFDNASRTQQDLTISAMFDQMGPELEAIYGDALITDIKNVFLDQPGPTIRHDVAHGLMGDHGPYSSDSTYACWLIFRLCLLPLFPVWQRLDENLWQ